MKKVKITTIILAIILVTIVSFGGVYIQTQNRMENKIKAYTYGRELKGERQLELKVSTASESSNSSESTDTSESEDTTTQDNLTPENYEIVKNTIEKRLKSLRTQDYTISLNKEDGTITVELPEDDKTDDLAYYLTTSGKVEIKEKDTSTELLNENMVKKAQYTYTSNSDGEYQVYLEIVLTKDGQAKIEEIQKDYAILKTDVDAAESAQKSEESTDNKENAESKESKENTDNTDNSNNEEKTENTEETKKIAKLSVAGNEYDIEKIEKNVIRAKIGSQTSNNTTVNNNVSKAAELAMLINSGKYPVDYKVQNNRFVYSDITHTQLIYAALVVAALIIIVFIIFIVKYKTKGLLVSISCVGFIALFFLLLRYTNVTISIEGIGAIILTMIIYLKLNQMILSKTKVMDVVNEAVKATYKNLFLKLVPVMIITVVFCFSGWTNLSSFGMIMFWGLVLLALYNVIVTKTLLKLNENK